MGGIRILRILIVTRRNQKTKNTGVGKQKTIKTTQQIVQEERCNNQNHLYPNMTYINDGKFTET